MAIYGQGRPDAGAVELGAALSDLFTGGARRRAEVRGTHYLKQKFDAFSAYEDARGKRAEANFQEARVGHQGAMTGDLVTRALGGDQSALGELGAAIMGMADGQPNFSTFTGGAKDVASMTIDRNIQQALEAGNVAAARQLSAVKTDRVLPELGDGGGVVFSPIDGGVDITELGDATIRQRDASAASSRASAQAALGRLGIAQQQFALQRAGQWNPGGASGSAGGRAGSGAGVKLTEQQSKDLVYLRRGQSANDRLETLADNMTASSGQQGMRGLADQFIRGLPGELGETGAANYLVSGERQQAEQAAREFLSAVLRKDTGAAITTQEFDIYGRTYLPQPGDSPAVLAQKRQSRQEALDAIQGGLGTATTLYQRQGPAAAPASAMRATNPATGEVVELRNGQWVPVR